MTLTEAKEYLRTRNLLATDRHSEFVYRDSSGATRAPPKWLSKPEPESLPPKPMRIVRSSKA